MDSFTLFPLSLAFVAASLLGGYVTRRRTATAQRQRHRHNRPGPAPIR